MTYFADHSIITQRYFFPMEVPFEPVTWVETPSTRLACYHVNNGHSKTVLYFHGNGEVVADYVPAFGDLFDKLGANIFVAEYRGYGMSTGVPQLAAMFEDLAAIQQAAGNPDELVVFGRSIGSIYACEFVNQFPNTAGLILESGINDVLERIVLRADPRELGTDMDTLRAEFKQLFDHDAKLAAYSGPSLILHAERDHLVGIEHAERNAAAAQDATFVRFPNGDHNTIFYANQAEYIRALGEFLS